MTDECQTDFIKNLNEKEIIVLAAKQLVLDRVEIEKDIEMEMVAINMKYGEKLSAINNKTVALVSGNEKADLSLITNIVKVIPNKDVLGSLPIQEVGIKGLDKYWLTAMKNVPALAEMISPADEAVLNHLTCISTTQIAPNKPHPSYPQFNAYGLLIEFMFSENPYFKNPILYKFFTLCISDKPEDIFEYEGFQPSKVDISTIDWLPEKNLTVKNIKKIQKHKKTKEIRHVTVSEKTDSFFNYFTKPEDVHLGPAYENEDKKDIFLALLDSDYELATFFHTQFVPKSILYYMNEVELDDDSSYDDEDDNSESNITSEEDNDQDTPHYSPAINSRGSQNRGGRGVARRPQQK